MGDVVRRKPKAPPWQHDPTPEERDERVGLQPQTGEDVLRKLLRGPAEEQAAGQELIAA
jgi:hypothetical protein